MTNILSTIVRSIFLRSTNDVFYDTLNAFKGTSACRALFHNRQLRQITISPREAVLRGSSKRNLEFKISHDPNFGIRNEVRYNVELKDLELNVEGDSLVMNLTWLRDNCHCDLCTHQFSRQRLFTPKVFHRRMFSVSEVLLLDRDASKERPLLWPSLDDGKILIVRWSDGHQSEYSLSWLSHVVKLNQRRQLDITMPGLFYKYPEDDFHLPTKNNCTETKYWNVSCIKASLDEVDYHHLIEGFEFNEDANFINANKIELMSPNRLKSLQSLSSQLVGLGLAKIVNVPRERNQVLNVAKTLAYERPTGYGVVFDVVVEPNEEINLAYSSVELDLHTDLSYREKSPGGQLLHCIRNSAEGGLSYFSDSFLAARTLQAEEPRLFETLTRIPVTFAARDPYRDIKFRRQHPMIKLDHEGKISEVNYSLFTMPPIGHRDDVKLFYLALDRFTQLLQAEENKYITKMNPGDLFIFHNRRVLHGRSAYEAKKSDRFLQGCYMDWDEITSLDEKLRSHMKSR